MKETYKDRFQFVCACIGNRSVHKISRRKIDKKYAQNIGLHG